MVQWEKAEDYTIKKPQKSTAIKSCFHQHFFFFLIIVKAEHPACKYIHKSVKSQYMKMKNKNWFSLWTYRTVLILYTYCQAISGHSINTRLPEKGTGPLISVELCSEGLQGDGYLWTRSGTELKSIPTVSLGKDMVKNVRIYILNTIYLRRLGLQKWKCGNDC